MNHFRNWFKNPITITLALVCVMVFGMADSCDTTNQGAAATSAQAAQQKANSHAAYIPKNDIEFNNYNKRMQISDDPTTILWCTSAFPIPSSPLFTIPVVGKLTSSTKRPYSTQTVNTTTNNSYSPELPGPDGMYGPSDSYRYGFTPAGTYVEFSSAMETYCTTEPTVWQRQSTTIVMDVDPKLAAAQKQAQAILAAGGPDAAAQAQAVISAALK